MPKERDKNGRFTKKKSYTDIWSPLSTGVRGTSFSNEYGNSEPSPYDLLGAYEDVTYSCVNLISNNIANVNVKLVATTATGEGRPKSLTKSIKGYEKRHLERNYARHTRKSLSVQEVVEHPLLDLLDRPNPYQNLGELLALTQTYLELIGSAFWYKARNNLGEVAELWLLPAQTIRIETEDGHVSGYVQQPIGGGDKVTYAPEDVIHFKFSNPTDPYTGFGVSPLRAIWQKVQLLRQEQSSWQAILNNMAFPSAIVSPPADGEMWAEMNAERVAKTLEERFRTGNQGGVWVVQDAIQYTPVSTPPKDLTALTMYDALKTAICNVYAVPKPLLDMSETNGPAATTAWRFFQMNCLKPRATRLMNTITHHLCPSRLFLATDEIVEPDKEYELQRCSAMFQSNAITQNEYRIEQGLDPLPGGDKFLYQLTGPTGSGTMGTLPSFQQERSAPPLKTKGLTFKAPDSRPLAVALRGFFKTMEGRLSLKAAPDLKTKSFFPFEDFTKELAETITPALRLCYEEGSKDVAAQLGGVPLLDVLNLSRAVNRAALVLADSTLRTTDQDMTDAVQATRDAVEAGLAAHEGNAQLAGRIKDIFTDLSERRCFLIAETESARAKMAGEVMEIEESGVDAKKVWLSDGMACPKCAPLNGVAKSLSEPFAVEGTGPYSQVDHPPYHPACRCTLTYELGD